MQQIQPWKSLALDRIQSHHHILANIGLRDDFMEILNSRSYTKIYWSPCEKAMDYDDIEKFFEDFVKILEKIML